MRHGLKECVDPEQVVVVKEVETLQKIDLISKVCMQDVTIAGWRSRFERDG